mmetsp:Transcript_79067/g.221687  ORF Transcript_79067/g.221687 Transcript_79067/m.221687 type:complete len:293 (-) Transcript_79067:156-1034(-)
MQTKVARAASVVVHRCGEATAPANRANASFVGIRVSHAARAMSSSSGSAAVWALGPEAIAPAPHYVFARIASARLPALDMELAGTLQLHMPHNIWSEHSLNGVQLACMRPGSLADSAASGLARAMARSSEMAAGLTSSRERWWLRRLLFLSTLSGAPAKAIVAAKGRATDKWTKSVLKEADSEQARLQILMEVHSIGRVGQSVVSATQGVLANGFLVAWCVMPRFCKWFGHYVDEEQVNAYTSLVEDLDAGRLQHFADMQASGLARAHYGLPEGASLREVFLRMKAEEMFSL